MTLTSKLAEVMMAVERVPKRGRNDFHKYDYATEADIVATVRKELASRQVMLIPHVDSVTRDGTITTAMMTFTFRDGESEEYIQSMWAGVGEDKGDKGLYKALTGGLKYFLLKTFLMPTGDDPEADDKAQLKARDKATVKPDKATKAARVLSPEAKEAGAVFVEKVIPKSSGNKEWAEVVFSNGETVIAREPGCISLAFNLAQEASPVIVTTSRNGKGNVQLDEIARWRSPQVELPPETPEPVGAF